MKIMYNTRTTDISFAQLGIGSILKFNQLVVPPNQREYSWTEKEVRTLFQDYAKAIMEGENSYFLGTVVTILYGPVDIGGSINGIPMQF